MGSNLALNPFKKGKKTEIESIKKVKVEGDLELQKAVDQYLSLDESYVKDIELLSPHDFSTGGFKDTPVLSPNKIYKFVDYLILNDLLKKDYQDTGVDGCYINNLIIISHICENHNDFVIDTKGHRIPYLGSFIKTHKEDNINLLIRGDTGYKGFQYTRGLNAVIEGDALGAFGEYSKNSNFVVKGNIGDQGGNNLEKSTLMVFGDAPMRFGFFSKDSTFHVKGNANVIGDRSRDCTYTIEGKMSPYVHLYSSLIKTHDPGVYRDLRKNKDFKSCYNKVKLLNEKGKVIRPYLIETIAEEIWEFFKCL